MKSRELMNEKEEEMGIQRTMLSVDNCKTLPMPAILETTRPVVAVPVTMLSLQSPPKLRSTQWVSSTQLAAPLLTLSVLIPSP